MLCDTSSAMTRANRVGTLEGATLEGTETFVSTAAPFTESPGFPVSLHLYETQ